MDSSAFFDEASNLLNDIMLPCAYLKFQKKQLFQLNLQMMGHSDPLTKMDLYFLNNLRPLLQCAFEDYVDGADDRPAQKERTTHIRTRFNHIQMTLPVIIQEVERRLAAKVVVPGQGDIVSRLEEARIEAQLLEKKLGDILSEVQSESETRKRSKTQVLAMQACLQRFAPMR